MDKDRDVLGKTSLGSSEPLQIKVVIENGEVAVVLKDQNVPVRVEVVDMDRDYENFERMAEYKASLKDSLLDCDYLVTSHADDLLISRDAAHRAAGDGYEQDEEVSRGAALEAAPVKVYAVSAGGVKREVYSGDLDECKLFCENNNWTFKDENDFEWDLEMEDSREALLPEGYWDALDHYSRQVGLDIENEFVRQHAEELVYCFRHEREFEVFDWWTALEEVLAEKLTFEEFRHMDLAYNWDRMSLQEAVRQKLDEVQEVLLEFRERDPHLFTCLGDKEFMFLVRGVDYEDAKRTGEEWYAKTFFEPGRFDCWCTNKADYESLNARGVLESKAYQRMVVKDSLDGAIRNAERSRVAPVKEGMVRDGRERG